MEPHPSVFGPRDKPKSLVLCFDGTGNKFQGTPADSNIVKIFSLLDRQDPTQFHYYQPGIGTYVENSSLAQKSAMGRLKSWYIKSKDQAIGTSFGEHVMAGYKFLMRYYQDGDHIYFFGFSRGAYTARFLAQMLDYVGLLTAGNEEMLRFAWKTYASWQMRTDETEKEKAKKKEMYKFMKHFRETFCRPIEPLRFLGLFDCVNSVPQFESAWMQRTKFPYTARSSARVIRHAVSIDERRAKFRQDLISEKKPPSAETYSGSKIEQEDDDEGDGMVRRLTRRNTDQARFVSRRPRQTKHLPPVQDDAASGVSVDSTTLVQERHAEALTKSVGKETEPEQDVLEVWFAGQHGDIGGGWGCGETERPLSDISLIWMLQEAIKAGTPFDEERLEAQGLLLKVHKTAPLLRVENEPIMGVKRSETMGLPLVGTSDDLVWLHTKSRVHDSLAFGGGMSWGGVIAWQIMEYLPFRRMDLQKDGSWKPISWPLPRGEVRDMPNEALIHGSAIRRLLTDENYRPGNLLLGGGGRGIRKAPKSAGTGHWKVARDPGDHTLEAVIRALPEEHDFKHEV